MCVMNTHAFVSFDFLCICWNGQGPTEIGYNTINNYDLAPKVGDFVWKIPGNPQLSPGGAYCSASQNYSEM